MIVAGVMFNKPLARLPRKIESVEARIFLLQLLDDAQALAIMLESAVRGHEPVEGVLAFVAERGVAEVMCQRDGLDEILIQPQGARDAAGGGGNFHRVREARAQVIAGAIEKDLRLVFQSAERA